MATHTVPSAAAELTTYRVRIRENQRYLAKEFASKFCFDATPETVAEFTDHATAARVAAAAQMDLEAPSLALRLPVPCTVEVVRVEWQNDGEVNRGFEIWQADARADECHRQARLLLAERRPAHLTAQRRAPAGVGELMTGARMLAGGAR